MSQAKPSSILVVDDTPENLRLLTRILSKQHYEVWTAATGEDALEAVHKNLPDLILLDIMMPHMDGYEVCLHLKANEATQDIPVIFISALNEISNEMAAFSLGGVDYITKPFQAEDVLVRVRTHLNLKEMRQILQIQNRLLQEQNRELDAFAHTVAHDLKNPLAKIIASLSLLQEYLPNLDDDLREIMQIGVGASHKMVSIINELLLLASVRKETIQPTPLDMASVVQQALNRLSHMLDTHQPELIVPEQWPVALGYAPWIEEVWANYLSNGLKYGGQPPRLELGAAPEPDGQIRFWVKDNGPGLSPEEQTRLFTEFTRLNPTRAQGHGLGLSIVQRIIYKLDGQCGVTSQPGRGSEFFFTLPAPLQAPNES